MKIQLIAVGTRAPGWMETGYYEYAKRLPPECGLQLIEITPAKRTKSSSIERAVYDEGQAILARLTPDTHVIALEVNGQPWSTAKLAEQLQNWMSSGQNIALLVGGPEGLSAECRQRAQQQWSLSALTLPHLLVRVIVAEALYRGWSLLSNHPYHRA